MEKLLYVLWKAPGEAAAEFNARLLGEARDRLTALRAHRLKINVIEQHHAAGAHHVQANFKPMPAAIVSFWLNSAHIRAPYQQALEAGVSWLAGYSVIESSALAHTVPVVSGERTEGYAQLAFFEKPPRLTYEGWLEVWQRDQTALAIETQSTFHYCQNIIVRPLTRGAPGWAAIVEEGFPEQAMTDAEVFYNAAGSPEKRQANFDRMMANVGRFTDFDKIDVLLTSEYRIGGWHDLDQPSLQDLGLANRT